VFLVGLFFYQRACIFVYLPMCRTVSYKESSVGQTKWRRGIFKNIHECSLFKLRNKFFSNIFVINAQERDVLLSVN